MKRLSSQTVDLRNNEISAVGSMTGGWVWVAAIGALLYVFRDWYQFLNPQFWAEDATVFFATSAREALTNFIHPYAGYFHFGPRSLAALAVLFPAVLAPTVFLYGAAAAAIASLVAIYLLTDTLPVGPRVLFALAPVLVLPAGEVYGNVTNTQWFLGVVLGVLVLTYRGDTFRSRWWFVLGAALALTGPFSVIFWPCFAAWSVLTRRVRVNVIMLTIVGVGALIQLAAIAKTGANSYGEGLAGPASWLLAGKIFMATFLTLRGLPGMVAVLAMAALLGYGLIMQRTRIRSGNLSLGLLCLSAVTLLAGLWTHRFSPGMINPLGPGERYYFQPFTFFLMALIASAPAAGKRYARLCVLVVILLVFGWTQHFRIEEKSDFKWREYYALSQVTHDLVIPIQPGWVLDINGRVQHNASKQIPVDLSKVSVRNGTLLTESAGTSLTSTAGRFDTYAQLAIAAPSQCNGVDHRFVRVSVKDAAYAYLQFYDARSRSADATSMSWHIGPGDHWYFDVPDTVDTRDIRVNVKGETDVVRGLGLAWLCW